MKAVHYYAAASWYGLSQGLQSFISPFLPIYYSKELGFTPSQIGLLAALRPWISAPAGSIAAALADCLGSHRFVLLFCFLTATALQSSIALVSSFPSLLVLTLGISIVWTGASIIGDAAVMTASTHPGDYGRVRTWASVMWIIISPLAGFINEKYGMRPSIAMYCLGSLFAVPAGWLLPLETLCLKREKETALIISLKEPLLGEPYVSAAAEEEEEVEVEVEVVVAPSATQPPPPSPPPSLARALAIVRFIEAITELGAVPPPSSLYGFAEVTTPYAARHFKDSEFNWEKNRRQGEEENEEEEVLLPTSTSTTSTTPLPRGMLSHDMCAEDLLRSVRDIHEPQQQQLQKDREEEERGGGGGVAEEEEVHEWMLGSPDMEQHQPEEEEEELVAVESPSRTSALQRLAQIFTWRSGGAGGGGVEHEEGEEDELSLPTTPMSHFNGSDTAESPSTSAAAHDLLSGFTPVKNYLESRKRRLITTREPSLTEPLGGISHHEISPSTSALEAIEEGGAGGGAVSAAPELFQAPAIFRAVISPELMCEALDMEAAEISGMDPTGSLVVDVLSKKLARMAAREKKRQAREKVKIDETARATPTTITLESRIVETSNTVPPTISTTTPTAESSFQTHSIWSRLVILFQDPSILSFFLIATLLGFGHGIIGTFLFMYLKHLGAGEGLMGWVLLANALPELPVFYFFGTILRVVGMDTLLLGSTAVLSLRIATYSLFNSSNNSADGTSTSFLGLPPLPLQFMYVLETLHAVTYAVGWSACALNASKIAPPGLESTTQAVFQGLWSGVGAGTGGLLGGIIYHWKGPDALFLCSAAVIGAGCCISGVVLGLQHRKRRYQRKHGSTLNLSAVTL